MGMDQECAVGGSEGRRHEGAQLPNRSVLVFAGINLVAVAIARGSLTGFMIGSLAAGLLACLGGYLKGVHDAMRDPAAGVYPGQCTVDRTAANVMALHAATKMDLAK